MSTLTVCRGLPASGKTTWARAWVAEDPGNRVRINRDDIRAMAHNGTFIKGVTEPRVIAIRDAQILALLQAGGDVVSDDTNLPARTVRDLAKLARQAGADVRIRDFTDVPLEVCIERDAARVKSVGEDVIRGMYDRFLRGGRALTVPPLGVEPCDIHGAGMASYVPRPDLPPAILVDLDGTVCLMNGRSPYDETRVITDLPNAPVITTVRALAAAGHLIVAVSGRTEGCRGDSERWLAQHLAVPVEALYMRAVGDTRKDWVVKAELFDRHVRLKYDVRLVLDDRSSVVAMWRRAGLTVLQVAEGNF